MISDALRNFSDGIAIIISYIAIRLGKKPRSFKYTFGLKPGKTLGIEHGFIVWVKFVCGKIPQCSRYLINSSIWATTAPAILSRL